MIFNWIKKTIFEPSTELDKEKYAEISKTESPLLVYFGKNNTRFAFFKKYCSSEFDLECYHSFDPEYIQSKGETEGISIFRKIRGGKTTYDSQSVFEIDGHDFSLWILDHKYPALRSFYEDITIRKLKVEIKTTFIYVDEELLKEGTLTYNQFDNVADKYSRRYNFAFSDLENKHLSMFLRTLKMTVDDLSLPCMIVIRMYQIAPEQYYVPLDRDGLSVQEFEQVITDYEENKYVMNLKSEPTPKNPVLETGVHQIVGNTWFNYRNHETKHLLVLFYHKNNQEDAKVFEFLVEFSKKILHQQPNLIIGAIDVQLNEVDFTSSEGELLPLIVHYLPGRGSYYEMFKEEYNIENLESHLVRYMKSDWMQSETEEPKIDSNSDL